MAGAKGSRAGGRTSPGIDWSAWAAFLADLEQEERALNFGAGEERFYRGHADRDWPLAPTLMRMFAADEIDDAESSLFFEFQARARELHHLQLSDWDVLFFMRHHGVPTRLLDWTETLGVALYFALEKFRDTGDVATKPCIWVMNPYALNEDDLFSPKNLGWNADEDSFYDYGDLLLEPERWWWEHPLAIYPQQKPARMGAQRGWFTIHGTDTAPLDRQRPEVVRRVDIPPAAIPAALEVLRISGVDAYGIYADLDGLAATLTEKNRPRRR